MIRRSLAGLLAALLAAPSFAAPIEAARLTAAPSFTSAPGAAASVGVLRAPSLSLSPAMAASLSFTAIAPSAAPAPAPAPALTALPAPIAAPERAPAPSAVSARGPPASPRSQAGVASRVADTVRTWGVPVESLLKDKDVLLIGEDHSSLTTIETVARELPRLAKAGVTAVGIEGLKTPRQKEVDDYVSRRTDRLPTDALGFSPARVTVFSDLLKAARANGVRVVALGLPLNEWAAQVAALAAQKTGDPAEVFGTDFLAQVDRAERRYEFGFNEALVEVLLTRRNQTMARLAWDALDAGGKAVIVAGQAHVPGPDVISTQRFHVRGHYGDLTQALAKLALKAYSLTFTGGLFTSVQAARDDREVRPEAHKIVVEAAPHGAPAFVPLGPDRGLWHAGGRTPVAYTH